MHDIKECIRFLAAATAVIWGPEEDRRAGILPKEKATKLADKLLIADFAENAHFRRQQRRRRLRDEFGDASDEDSDCFTEDSDDDLLEKAPDKPLARKMMKGVVREGKGGLDVITTERRVLKRDNHVF